MGNLSQHFRRRLCLESLENRELLSVSPLSPPPEIAPTSAQIAPFAANMTDAEAAAYERQLIDSQGIAAYAQFDLINGYERLTAFAYFDGGQFASLDLSNCTALTSVFLMGDVGSLDLSGCTEIYDLTVFGYTVTSLNASGCTALTYLDCSNFGLTTLNIAGCTQLSTLTLDGNAITALNVSGTAITTLNCDAWDIVALDVTNCSSLETLSCADNLLATLDLTGCTALKNLDCSGNQLTTLVLEDQSGMQNLDCSNNKLSFGNLPLPSVMNVADRGNFFYANQDVTLTIEGTVGPNNEVIVKSDDPFTLTDTFWDDTAMSVRWFLENGTEISSDKFTVQNGQFILSSDLVGQTVYAEISNSNYAGLTLRTNSVLVELGIRFDPPNLLRATQSSQTVLALQWNAIPGATQYILQRKGPGDSDFVTIYSGEKSRFVDANLDPDTVYEYRVQAMGSLFSEAVPIATAPTSVGGMPVMDAPIHLSTEIDENGAITITWTDLGPDYVYTVLKGGYAVVNFSQDEASNAYYVDNDPPSSGVEGYGILAYNVVLQEYAPVLIVVVHTTAMPVEITGHEMQPDGSVKLMWDALPNVQYSIFRAGVEVAGPITSDGPTAEWIDENPSSLNEYKLVALYLDGGDWRETYSNIYRVIVPGNTVNFALSNFDWSEFWSDYELENELIV